MNITDIDDKIIRRARHAHLFHHYLDEGRGLTEVRADVSSAMKVYIVLCVPCSTGTAAGVCPVALALLLVCAL